ncbi:MAG: hypothetical protein R3F02_18410 [Thiolinea sp.]
MQNFADYYSTMLARQLLKESREQRTDAGNTSDAGQDDADQIAAEHMHEDLLEYAVFYNPGCGHQSGHETKGQSKAFLKRWLSFYQADNTALPQHRNLQRLEQRKRVLNKEHAKTTAPLLATLLICLIIASLLMFGNSLFLLLIPVVLFFLVWLRVYKEVRQSSQRLKNNKKLRQQQAELLEHLSGQVSHINALENVLRLQENYTRTLEGFLRRSLSDFIPALDDWSVRDQLHTGQMQVFVLESPGILQIPDLCRQSPERLTDLGSLVRPGAEIWCAEQPYAELEGLTRIHYVCAAMLLEQGIILCHAYYDWVSDRIHAAGSDYVSWQNLLLPRLFETRFPAENVLSGDLSDELYRTHFGEPVKVFSVAVRNGEQHGCTLPLHQPLRQTLSTNMPGTLLVRHLKRDVVRLHSVLSMRIQQEQAKSRASGARKVADTHSAG